MSLVATRLARATWRQAACARKAGPIHFLKIQKRNDSTSDMMTLVVIGK